jgi:lysophospholipase L1-like esterase
MHMPPPHLVLLGDSIFDNAAYTQGEPGVVEHLRDVAPDGWRATLCAVDGATVDGLDRQLRCLPADASHIVISIGGNDVLSHVDLLSMRAASVADALEELGRRVEKFAKEYRAAIANVLRFHKQTIVCTIYEGQLEPKLQRAARVALSVFNDAILRTATELRVPIIELRSVCVLPSDYANPIEPSGSGGRKIAIAIRDAIVKLPR